MNDDEHLAKSGPDLTRERLIASGLRLLAKKGYKGAITREIATEAGVTEMTLYRHFRSKNELFAAAISQNREALLSLIPEPSGDMGTDFLRISQNMAEQVSSKTLLLVRILPELSENPALKQGMHEIQVQLRSRLMSLVDHYRTPETPHDLTDTMIYYMFLGPILLFSLSGPEDSGDFDNHQHVQFLLRGCGLAE